MNIKEMDGAYIAQTYNRFPVEIASGQGSTLVAADGKQYIDMGSGIAVNAFGVQDEEWKAAVIGQINQVQHTSNLYYTAPQAKLAEMLCQRTGMKKVFFGNSGAEANECAIKTARKYAHDHGKKAATIVTLQNSFHGRTMATLSATGQEALHQFFDPFLPGFRHVPANDLAAMKAELEKGDVAAVMIELVQGEGGVNVLEKEYVQALSQKLKEKDILLIVDEVQTGNGRTGALYAYQLYDILPDLVTTAKGLAGGLPMGACLLGEKVQQTLVPGSHGSTFGGNPVCAAGAISILSRIDDRLLRLVRKKHDRILEALLPLKGVKSISGLGLMLGIAPVRPAGEIVQALLEKGVLVLTAKEKVRLLPALNISNGELNQALSIMKEVFAS